MQQVIWEMAERFHWPLEYVEALPLSRLHEWQQIIDGRSKGLAERERKAQFLRGNKRR